jgi:hypothetical protein
MPNAISQRSLSNVQDACDDAARLQPALLRMPIPHRAAYGATKYELRAASAVAICSPRSDAVDRRQSRVRRKSSSSHARDDNVASVSNRSLDPFASTPPAGGLPGQPRASDHLMQREAVHRAGEFSRRGVSQWRLPIFPSRMPWSEVCACVSWTSAMGLPWCWFTGRAGHGARGRATSEFWPILTASSRSTYRVSVHRSRSRPLRHAAIRPASVAALA